jgi:uncharacterized membrane protein YbhN (UPF0104 family)
MNATIDMQPAQSDAITLPGARQIARRLAWLLALGAAGVFVLTAMPGLEAVPKHLAGADPAWIAGALIFEIASTLAFAVAFHGAFARRTARRTSASVSMAIQGMNIVLPAGGTGGLAVGAAILDRAGVPRSFAASRTVALFLLTSAVSFLAIALAGLGVATGLLSGDAALSLTLLPAAGALLVVAGVVLLPRLLRPADARPEGRLRGAAWNARIYLRDGVASSAGLLRDKDGLVIWGAIGYFAFDVAAIAASFMALGTDGIPIGLLVLAYTLGHAGAIVPLPGSAEGGLIGMFVLYGVPLTTATAGVLAYRVVHAGVPMVLGLAGLADVRRLLRSGPPVRENRQPSPAFA